MFVCLCKGITEAQVQDAIANGAHSLEAISAQLGVAQECGGCEHFTQELLKASAQHAHAQTVNIPLHQIA